MELIGGSPGWRKDEPRRLAIEDFRRYQIPKCHSKRPGKSCYPFAAGLQGSR